MIQRKLFKHLKIHLEHREISLIIGPRQAGKTTLMFILKDFLQRQGARTLFLSLDLESDRPFFRSQAALVDKIRLEIGEGKGYVFIDEIQRKENAGLFLKGLYDLGLPYKIIVSGSDSVELKEKIHESLIGRKRIFELNTISFDEFVNFKTGYLYSQKLSDFFVVEKEKIERFLNEYLAFGGYPRVVLETKSREKMLIMDDIYRSYLEKDIYYLLRIEKEEAFKNLIRILASQIGKIINYSEFSSTLGIAVKTIKNYLWYAEKTFVVEKVTPYFRNIRKEITKSPVYYFKDLGLRNYCLGLFGNLVSPSEMSFVFQNFVFNILKDKLVYTPAELHFWRTKDKAEVDFIVNLGGELLPVEVKFKKLKKPVIGRSLRSFITRYKPRHAWIVNLSLSENVELNLTKIHFLPYYELLFAPIPFLRTI